MGSCAHTTPHCISLDVNLSECANGSKQMSCTVPVHNAWLCEHVACSTNALIDTCHLMHTFLICLSAYLLNMLKVQAIDAHVFLCCAIHPLAPEVTTLTSSFALWVFAHISGELNKLWSRDAYMYQNSIPTLIQIMACRLLEGNKLDHYWFR